MKTLFSTLTVGLLLAGATSRRPAAVKEYLSVPEPIRVGSTDFRLAWSSHPTPNYYKQEYTPVGETVEKYNQMVMVEVVLGDLTVKDAVTAQIATIEARKQADPVAEYQVMENAGTGEMLLDFTMSAGPPEALTIAEWNAYRYQRFQDESGRKGVVLFAISKRGYGPEIAKFLASTQTKRAATVQAVAGFKMPAVAVKQ